MDRKNCSTFEALSKKLLMKLWAKCITSIPCRQWKNKAGSELGKKHIL